MPAEGINNYHASGISRTTGLSTAEKISPRATQIMDLHIQGLRSKDIAARLGLTPRYVGEIINAPNFQHTLAIRRSLFEEKLDNKIVNTTISAADEIKKHAKAAADRLVSLLDGDSESTQMKASTEILDRVGIVSQKKGAEVSASVVIVDEKSAALINETLRMEMGEGDG